MKLGYLLIVAFLAVLMIHACTKSSTAKKPQLTLESITKVIQGGDSTMASDSMTAMFKFVNSGGTLGNGTFGYIRIRLSQSAVANQLGSDTQYTSIPDFGGVSKGEFKLVRGYGDYLAEGFPQTNDTMIFKFF